MPRQSRQHKGTSGGTFHFLDVIPWRTPLAHDSIAPGGGGIIQLKNPSIFRCLYLVFVLFWQENQQNLFGFWLVQVRLYPVDVCPQCRQLFLNGFIAPVDVVNPIDGGGSPGSKACNDKGGTGP